MTSNPEHSAAPRTVPGDQPGDYGVGDLAPGSYGAGPYGEGPYGGADPSNCEDIDQLTAPLEDDDDVHERIALVNTEQPDRLRQAPGGCTDGR